MNNESAQIIRKVVVAGGGTAGWMAAAAISKLIGTHLECPVTLIESDEIGTVGVGESTIPTLKHFHNLLGINENNFIKATGGTFKLGINFENWKTEQHEYFHAFGQTGRGSWACGFQHFWLKAVKDYGLEKEFGEYCLEWRAAKELKFSHLQNDGLNHAYHIDATAYGQFLRRYSGFFGVQRIEGKIEQVNLHGENGNIESLTLASGENIEGDLFIDCTGQRALLIGGALKVPYEDWSEQLLSDSAIAVQTDSHRPPVPFTRAIAHQAGWRWQIPLQTRVGNGLVYSSAHMSDDEAMDTLINGLDGKALIEPRQIRFKTGMRQQQWYRNCVSIGLSSGFIEPLESTSIHLIQSGILRLLKIFPYHGIKQIDIDNYNRKTRYEIERIRDFIILHYHVNQRDDSQFWRDCRNMVVPELLQNKIDAFQQTGRVFHDPQEMFGDSWMQVMLGQGIEPEAFHPIMNTLSKQEMAQFLTSISHNISQALGQLTSHDEYVTQFTANATLDISDGILNASVRGQTNNNQQPHTQTASPNTR